MSSTTRALVRPLRSLVAARRTFATLPTKNPTPSGPIEPSRTQAHPIGAFYEAILNTPQLLPERKPEEPASTVKDNVEAAAPAESAEPAPAKRSRKAKGSKTEPAATATSSSAPTAPASKSSVSSNLSSSSSSPSGAPPPSTTATEPSTQEKAKVIFGSTLAGPAERAERLAQIRIKSTVVAGVVVPPKPEEPDNCCMSGCVNCVWERFRDEMEMWAAANTEAQRRLAAAAAGKKTEGTEQQHRPAVDLSTVSMDDDGGGSETNWDVGAVPAATTASGKRAPDFWDEELYKNVPVGIREFMKQEKKLKEKHIREGTSGGYGA